MEPKEWIQIIAIIVTAPAVLIAVWKYIKESGVKDQRLKDAEDQLKVMKAEWATTVAAQLRHFTECDSRMMEQAKLNERLATACEEVSTIRRSQLWQGDCIVRIATSADVRLPERPN